MDISYVTGNILLAEVDAIVNPTNRWLIAGGGLCGQIYKAANKTRLEEYTLDFRKSHFGEEAEVGSCFISPAFELHQKHLIHVVTPKYHVDPIETLEKCYTEVLQVAEINECESIAIPLLGSGTNQIPKDLSLDYFHKSSERVTLNKLSKIAVYMSKM